MVFYRVSGYWSLVQRPGLLQNPMRTKRRGEENCLPAEVFQSFGAKTKWEVHGVEALMAEFGKLLILCGIVLVVAGLVAVLVGRTSLPLGRLPGDFVFRGKNTSFYFPLATSLVVSLVLSILLYVIGRWKR